MGKIFVTFQFFTLLFLSSFVLCRDFSKSALIIVDVQNDFLAGGTLPVPHGDEVIPVINKLRSKIEFGQTVFTMDWHPPNHVSFHQRFANMDMDTVTTAPVDESGRMMETSMPKLFDEHIFDLNDGRGCRKQKLWPVHCVQNTTGAELRIGLIRNDSDIMVLKGTKPDVDSYSGFWDNDKSSETEMDAILKSYGVEELIFTGLAFELCVGQTALDGVKKGYKVTVVKDATGSFGHPLEMETKLNAAGVRLVTSDDLILDFNIPDGRHSGCQCLSCRCPGCTCMLAEGTGENSCQCPNCFCPGCTCNNI